MMHLFAHIHNTVFINRCKNSHALSRIMRNVGVALCGRVARLSRNHQDSDVSVRGRVESRAACRFMAGDSDSLRRPIPGRSIIRRLAAARSGQYSDWAGLSQVIVCGWGSGVRRGGGGRGGGARGVDCGVWREEVSMKLTKDGCRR